MLKDARQRCLHTISTCRDTGRDAVVVCTTSSTTTHLFLALHTSMVVFSELHQKAFLRAG